MVIVHLEKLKLEVYHTLALTCSAHGALLRSHHLRALLQRHFCCGFSVQMAVIVALRGWTKEYQLDLYPDILD